VRSFPRAARLPLTSLLLFFPALPAFPLGGWLELDRAAVARGEVWRLLTGHWTHWTLDHLLWDSLAFLALAVFCEVRISRRRLLATVAGSALAVSAGVWFVLPEIARYRGLSGIDSALFMLLAVTILRETRSPLAAVAVAAFLAKAAWEVSTGSTLFTEAAGSFVPVPLAHLIGGAWGLALGSGRPPHPRAWRKGWWRRPAAPVTISRVCSGSSPAVSRPGADPWGRPRNGRSNSP
jgi:rhomboid family GlyGly-CTERM serine protease